MKLPSAVELRKQATALGIDYSTVNFRIKEQKNRLWLQIKLALEATIVEPTPTPEPTPESAPASKAERDDLIAEARAFASSTDTELIRLREENARLQKELALVKAELAQVSNKKQEQRERAKARAEDKKDKRYLQKQLDEVIKLLKPAVEEKYKGIDWTREYGLRVAASLKTQLKEQLLEQGYCARTRIETHDYYAYFHNPNHVPNKRGFYVKAEADHSARVPMHTLPHSLLQLMIELDYVELQTPNELVAILRKLDKEVNQLDTLDIVTTEEPDYQLLEERAKLQRMFDLE